MKITAKHYYFFGEKSAEVGGNLISPKSWDILRMHENLENPFSLPESRDAWIKKSRNNTQSVKGAESISNLLKQKNYKRIESFGVGAAFMEYNLKIKHPDIFLSCYDFAPKTVARLKNLFVEAEKIEVFDILNDNFINKGEGTLYLLYRVDNEFDNKQWRAIFKKISLAGIKNILFVPCDVSTIKSLIKSRLGYLSQIISGRRLSFAGYLRTKDQFKELFYKYYNLVKEFPVGDLTGFLLEKK